MCQLRIDYPSIDLLIDRLWTAIHLTAIYDVALRLEPPGYIFFEKHFKG